MELDIELDISGSQIAGAMDDKSASLIFGGDSIGFTLSADSADRLKDALKEGIGILDAMLESRKHPKVTYGNEAEANLQILHEDSSKGY